MGDADRRTFCPTPRYFPYFITVASLTIIFIGVLLWLISRRLLLPSIVVIGGFLFFVLWTVGLVAVSIELWGPQGGVSDNCNNLVFGHESTGNSQATLAWLQQRSICEFGGRPFPSFPLLSSRTYTDGCVGQSWQAVFAMALVGCIFLLWIIVIAVQVFMHEG